MEVETCTGSLVISMAVSNTCNWPWIRQRAIGFASRNLNLTHASYLYNSVLRVNQLVKAKPGLELRRGGIL